MSKNNTTRSKFLLDAVVQAAAGVPAGPLNPLQKLGAIAGLAGFVLRLFRSRRPAPGAAARFQQGSGKAVRRKPAAAGKGGPGHG